MILGSVKEGDFASEIQAPILMYYYRLIERAFDTNYMDEVKRLQCPLFEAYVDEGKSSKL